MIKQFTDAWFSHKHLVQEQFTAAHPESYIDVVRAVVEMISAAIDGAFGAPDPQRIHELGFTTAPPAHILAGVRAAVAGPAPGRGLCAHRRCRNTCARVQCQ